MTEKELHIGIILDGNRRYAKKHGWETLTGHTKGFEKAKKLFDWQKELKIKELSLYCFSIQNFNRSKEEINYLFEIFTKNAEELLTDKRISENKVKIRFVGRTNMFPKEMQEIMKKVEEKTANHENYTVNFAMAYGGREEIIDATKKTLEKGEEITEKNIQKNMWVQKDMDIMIRTSGEYRTSNFFIWQASYAELFFIKKHWPEFEKEDLKQILEEYNTKRKRRFGGN